MKPFNRETFIKYCLRRLGSDVIEINVSPEQVEDRVDDAFQFFEDRHFEGVEKVYLKHTVTADDIANGYITISDMITSVTRIISSSSASSYNPGNPFDFKYQFALSEMHNIASNSLIYYDQVMSHLALIDYMFNAMPQFEFSKYKNQISIMGQWGTDIREGDILVFECYRVLDPAQYPLLWNDYWLKKYATALIKLQWGRNLSKYIGMQLPGGTSFNGQQIYQEAKEEVDTLEKDMISMFEFPPIGGLY